MTEELTITKTIEDDILNIFIPMKVTRRAGRAMIIMPDFDQIQMISNQKRLDEKIINLLAKAYRWKVMLEQNLISSLAEISRKEKLSKTYVSKVYNLNFLSPRIVEGILDGTGPAVNIKIRDILNEELPSLWVEQEENWGFNN